MKDVGTSKPYVLGLDIGVQSIGWALIGLDDGDRPFALRRTGVRCFDSGVGSETQIQLGNDESTNAKRRQARQQRRQLFRRAQRQRRVFRILQRAGLLPGSSAAAVDRHELLQRLDAELATQFGVPGDRVADHVLPYRLRARALGEALPPFALGRAIYHLAQRRGFLSNKKAQGDDKEEGEVKQAISKLHAEIERTGARTVGEYFSRLDPEDTRIRKRWTHRQMFLDEFEKIWAAQAPHHPRMDDGLKQKLQRAMFFQRPLRSQKGMVGRCELEPDCRRAPLASLQAQRFRYLQKINDLEITTPDGEIRTVTAEQRAVLSAAFEEKGELTFAGIRRVLGLKKTKGDEHDYEFNLERGGEKKLFGNRTGEKLARALGDRWRNLSASEQETLVHEMLCFQHEDALARRLEKAWKFDPATAAAVAAVRLEPGYSAYSRRALEQLLPKLADGVRLNTIRKDLYGDRLAESKVWDLLPPVREAFGSLRNPVVCRALTELRKLVNAIVRHYGKPKMVRIELARDMKRSRRQREDATKEMRKNEKQRDAAKAKILAELGISDPSRSDVLKFLLAEECNWECPYTGKPITPRQLVGQSPQFDIEHILPFSRSLDDSFANKTLCYHEENRNVKQHRTPWEAYHGDVQRWHEILMRCRRFRGSMAGEKQRRFQMEELPEDFAERHLNDTRYASRLAAEYVGLLFGGQVDREGKRCVQVSAGRVTAFLRDEWALNAILSGGREKTRDDHRHHAVDALVIALTEPRSIKLLTRAALRAQELGRRLLVPLDPPWGEHESFLADVRSSIETVNVSYRVDRRVSGALHQETLYSPPHHAIDGKGKPAEYHHIRKPLVNMSADEVEEIVDQSVRAAVKAKLEQIGGEPKNIFAEPANHPYFRTKDGRLIPIHKARIRKKVSVIPVGDDRRRRYVAPGSNHHIEIVANLDAQGHEESWGGLLVSLYEATRRVDAGEPVVQRDHGPGKKFLFSLTGGEYVLMRQESGENHQLCRVVVITDGQVEFRLHTDARPSTVTKKSPGARIRVSPGAMKRRGARKVAVDPLGNILPAND